MQQSPIFFNVLKKNHTGFATIKYEYKLFWTQFLPSRCVLGTYFNCHYKFTKNICTKWKLILWSANHKYNSKEKHEFRISSVFQLDTFNEMATIELVFFFYDGGVWASLCTPRLFHPVRHTFHQLMYQLTLSTRTHHMDEIT